MPGCGQVHRVLQTIYCPHCNSWRILISSRSLDPDMIKTMYQGDTDLDNRNPRPPEQASATSRAPPPAGPAQSGWWRLISVHFKPLLVIIQHLELRCISTFDIQNQSLNLWLVEPMFALEELTIPCAHQFL